MTFPYMVLLAQEDHLVVLFVRTAKLHFLVRGSKSGDIKYRTGNIFIVNGFNGFCS